MSIKNLPIIGKILLVIAMFGLMSIASTVFSTGKMREIADGYTSSINQQGRAAEYLARANRALNGARASIAVLIISTTDAGNANAIDDLEKAKASFNKFTDMADEADSTDLIDVKTLKARGLEIINKACAQSVVLGNSTGDMTAARNEYNANCGPAFAPLSEAMTAAVDKAMATQDAVAAQLAATTANTILITYGVVLGGLALAIAGSFAAIRSWVSRPLAVLTQIMGRLAAGDLAVSVDGRDRKDEIGKMAGAVQVFKDNGLKLKASEAEAARAQVVAQEMQAKTAAQRAKAAAEQAQVVTAIASGLESLAHGELTYRIDDHFAAEYDKLRVDFNDAMVKLEETMSIVSQNTQAIRSGTTEISTASDDLSRRTEQQAASLEETAAALDEITATVKKTSEGSRLARTVVTDAKANAETSGSVVSDAVAAMSGIEKSSQQVTQIVGVIDEIAFQTNLLALNAGVEAARAGDAGRGFAVVASEVRALAQRSAEAAKEIKALISTSSQQVSAGVGLVHRTGEALKRIVVQVNEIDAVVTDIATSTQEQATALQQVNTAINQMDQVTQQNAAMVEESTAASHALTKETEDLAQLIGRFKIGAGASNQHGVARAQTKPTRSKTPVRSLKTVGHGGAARKPEAKAEESWQDF